MRPDFVWQVPAARVVFGAGRAASVGEEVERLGWQRALVLSTPGHRHQAVALADRLGSRGVGVFDQAAMHVPLAVAQAGRQAAQDCAADGLVAVGGGSTIGLAKAIALTLELPILAVPTTYAGSEMTPIHGITDAGVKKTGQDPKVVPRVVVYDPLLTLTMPRRLVVTSAMNAMAHAVEALYARDANPISDLMAREGVRALAHALPRRHENPQDVSAAAEALYGAWLCGAVLGQVGMALHHKLCHVLGGSFGLPHAEVHTVVLPYALAYNAPAVPDAMHALREALGGDDPPGALQALAKALGAPTSLRQLGMQAHDLDRAADLAAREPYWNPRPVERALVRELLQRAQEGDSPSARLRA